MSSFSGKIKEFPQISVDRFDGRNLASTAYFLSHAHSDHMIGLSSPQFLDHLESNSGVYLYCSQITARFLQSSIRHRPLSPYVVPLQLEEPVKITIPNVAEEATHQVWVTLIPAAHCPGSVMFLFEGRGGTVLYTGDFRISVGEVARLRSLHDREGTVKILDSLHIDTTFCHRDIMYFPSREQSSQAIEEAVEDWLARGNNFLIHLLCPANYGYEFIYRSLHDRFGMKIHVSRWKFRMYDTVPEIQEALTLDATATWIHACDFRNKNEAETAEKVTRKQLPCQCVPYGVNSTPNIRIIKPSALFYTLFQSAKEIKQISSDGTFCRILLSLHASCSEVLDMVSYLRPRKVLPNVIPMNSSKDEVLKLLHEALSRSGDHYSIEYGGNQHPSFGSYKRQLDSANSSFSAGGSCKSLMEMSILDSFMSPPNKKRRYSDSNMIVPLPAFRGNIKGSLSLEGEATTVNNTQSSVYSHLNISNPQGKGFDNQELGSELNSKNADSLPSKEDVDENPSNFPEDHSNDTESRMSINQVNSQSILLLEATPCVANVQSLLDKTLMGASNILHNGSSSVLGKGDKNVTFHSDKITQNEDSDANNKHNSSDIPILHTNISGLKQSRKLWYKYKHFSTPIREVEKNATSNDKPTFGLRSSSLPLPDSSLSKVKSCSEFSVSCDAAKDIPILVLSSSDANIDNSSHSLEGSNITLSSDHLIHDKCSSESDASHLNPKNEFDSLFRPSVIRPLPLSNPPYKATDISKRSAKSNSNSLLSQANACKPVDTGWFKRKKTVDFSITTKDPNELKNDIIPAIADFNSGTTVLSNCSPILVDLVSCDSDISPSPIQQENNTLVPNHGAAVCRAVNVTPRSSCLKTSFRRNNDRIEVVTLDHQTLGQS